jgi:hypothetical protein
MGRVPSGGEPAPQRTVAGSLPPLWGHAGRGLVLAPAQTALHAWAASGERLRLAMHAANGDDPEPNGRPKAPGSVIRSAPYRAPGRGS